MIKRVKQLFVTFLAAAMLVGTISFTNAEAALAKPGNCHFVKWNNTSFTSCRIAWKAVSGANFYLVQVAWTDGSHAKTYGTNNTYVDIKNLANNHVSQARVVAVYYDPYYDKVTDASAWSNIEYITPSPKKISGKLPNKKRAEYKLSWNTVYGSNGYNVFLTTNPRGTWYWNQSTATKATATSALIKRYRGSKLKTYQNYYFRIVTRRKRNGVFCTVPLPSNYATGYFYLWK